MRESCDKTATFFNAVEIIMQIEEDQGIEIPDSVVQNAQPWEKLTIRDLVDASNQCLGDRGNLSPAKAAVISAIKAVFPSAPDEAIANIERRRSNTPHKQ